MEYARTLQGLRSEGNPEGITKFGEICEKVEHDFYRDHGFWPSDEYVEDTANDILERRKYALLSMKEEYEDMIEERRRERCHND